MTEHTNGWAEYKIHVIDTLRRLEMGQAANAERLEEALTVQSKRLDALEQIVAEGRGAWKVAAFVSGPVGGLVVFLLSKLHLL